MPSAKLVCWNLNGIRAVEKRGFFEIFRGFQCDALCLQETKAEPSQLSEALLNPPGYSSHWAWADKKGYSGTAIYSGLKPIKVQRGLGIPELDNEGRFLWAEYEDFHLFSIYFPNSQEELRRIDHRLAFGDAVLSFLKKNCGDKMRILCGDFNVAHQPIDLARPKENQENPGYSLAERRWFDKLLAEGYVDSFRLFNQSPGQYSWWSNRAGSRERNVGWRIDYFVVSTEHQSRLKSAGILPGVLGSDHCPITLEIETAQTTRV